MKDYFVNMMILTSHKPGGIAFHKDFIKLFIISRNKTELVYSCR